MATDEATPQVPLALTSEERTWAMLCHLSVLLAHFAVGMTFLGPLICWLMKKDTSAFVDHHGREALNFELNILVYVLVSIPLFFCFVGFFTLPAAITYNVVMVIIAGIKANSGEMFRYPFIFRVI
jgi:uncharacterized Tic20 family protein